MKIVFWADFITDKLEASVSGDVLTINGEKFDFSPITEGMQLPGEAVGNDWFPAFPITRINGELTVTIKLPVQLETPVAVRSPEVPLFVIVTKGKVLLPDTTPINPDLPEGAPVEFPEEVNVDGPEPDETNPDAGAAGQGS